MRLVLFVLLFTICLTSSAQFSNHVDEGENVTYFKDTGYDEALYELYDSETRDDLSAIQAYLRQRDAAREQQQAKRRTKSAIGLNHRRIDLNRSLNSRKCRDLTRWGLKCY
jgi:uncharacterized protein with von Willebrand factor type A (vWA) domain